jgi:hypothetical protein
MNKQNKGTLFVGIKIESTQQINQSKSIPSNLSESHVEQYEVFEKQN